MRPGLTCVMSAMQAFFGGNLSLIFASLSQSEVRRDYPSTAPRSLRRSRSPQRRRTREDVESDTPLGCASHRWQMMQEMICHPRHLGMELVEHKLHLQWLLWWLMR